MLLNEMNGVAGDVVENQRTNVLKEANAERQRHQRQSQQHLQAYQQDVQHQLSEENEVQSHLVASREEVNMVRHELSQSPAGGTQYQTPSNTTAGATESSSEIQQLRHERDTLSTSLSQFGRRNTKMPKRDHFL